jgi:hypothetical protein
MLIWSTAITAGLLLTRQRQWFRTPWMQGQTFEQTTTGTPVTFGKTLGRPVLGFCVQLLGRRSLQRRLLTLVLKLLLRWDVVDAKLQDYEDPVRQDDDSYVTEIQVPIAKV